MAKELLRLHSGQSRGTFTAVAGTTAQTLVLVSTQATPSGVLLNTYKATRPLKVS
jgi:hypothetical protein